jgi:glycolate oxidase FAD binding subunit
MSLFALFDLDELRDAVGLAPSAEEPVEVVGGGSKRGHGWPLQEPHTLDLSLIAGILSARHSVEGW